MPRHCCASMPWWTPSPRSRRKRKPPCRREIRLAPLVSDIGRWWKPALEIAVGDRHMIARILLGGLAQRLEVPGKVGAAPQRLEHHQTRLLARHHFIGDPRNVEFLLN